MKRDAIRLEPHPLAELFPKLGGAEYDALRDDIAAHGLLHPIVVLNGTILDGRNRYEACLELGIEPATVEFDGDDPAAFVLSVNLHRRHLTAGQQGAVTALAMQWQAAQPIPEQNSRECNIAPAPQQKPKKQASASLDKIAAAAGVSPRTLKMSKKVAKADPELAKEVAAGTVSLPAAVEQVTGRRPGGASKPAKDAAARLPDLERQVAELTAQNEQLSADNKELLAENEAMAKIIDADDRLKAAHSEIKKLQGVIAKLEQRITGLQNEKNAAIRAAKSAQKKAK